MAALLFIAAWKWSSPTKDPFSHSSCASSHCALAQAIKAMVTTSLRHASHCSLLISELCDLEFVFSVSFIFLHLH